MQLRDYQKDIIKQTIESDKSTLIQIPTGGGKTIIAKEIISDLVGRYDKQVLFVAPKIILMEQTADVFKGLNTYIMHGTKKDYKNHKVLVSTIQTASKRDVNPDVIIVDEIHYGFEGKMLKNLIKNKPHTRIIGLSATPYDKNGELLKGFGLVLDKYDVKYMVQNKYLVDIKSHVLVKIYKLDTVKISGNDYNEKELSKLVSNNKTILEIVKSSAEHILNCKKTIVFAVDISHAELLAKAYRNEGFTAKVIHSDIDTEENKREIRRFREGQTKILVSVAMLTTGFDVPDTDIAVIARPTKSQNLYKQMVGRVLRPAKNKVNALLLDCGNVIENLGYPLEPIKTKFVEERQNSNQKCESCGSEKITLKVIKGKSFWICIKCGYKKSMEQGSYECKLCGKHYTHNAKFTLSNDKLYLECDTCPYPTLISKYTGNEKLIELYDKKYKKIKKPEKSLVAKLEEKRREKVLEEELQKAKIQEEKVKHFMEKIVDNYRENLTKRLLSSIESAKMSLDDFRTFINGNEYNEKIDMFRKRIFNTLESPYIDLINIKYDFENLSEEIREEIYSNYINEEYQNKLKKYVENLFKSYKQNLTDEEFENFWLSDTDAKSLQIKRKEYSRIYTSEELKLLKINCDIKTTYFIDGKFWTTTITGSE